MDKDSVILRYEQLETDALSDDINILKNKNNAQSLELDDIQKRINKAYALLGKTPPHIESKRNVINSPQEKSHVDESSYDELFEKAKCSLICRGLDVESIDYHSLVSQRELDEIINDLNKPLSRKEKWTKNDFIAVFIAASIGSLADIVLGDRDNPLTGQDSTFADWLNSFHKHPSGAPIDYQGEGFGGGYHRGLSRGHDVLRFIEAILMFKNGEFIGVRYKNGQAINIISHVNQYGTPYEQLSTIEAILQYAKHMFADLLSKCSLPFPGSSFLAESNNRQLRKIAADMYQNGINCKNIIIQSLSTIIIEVIIRLYLSIETVKQDKSTIEIDEDYTGVSQGKSLFKRINQEKLNEMLLVAHTIVTAINIGKIVITKSPWDINVTEIISVVKYGVKVLMATADRHSEYAKIIRNSDEIHKRWVSIEEEVCPNDIIEAMNAPLVI